jgi:hypothetical protein
MEGNLGGMPDVSDPTWSKHLDSDLVDGPVELTGGQVGVDLSHRTGGVAEELPGGIWAYSIQRKPARMRVPQAVKVELVVEFP